MRKIVEIINSLIDFIIIRDEEVTILKKLNSDEIFNYLKTELSYHSGFVLSLFSYQKPLIKKLIWQMKFRDNQWVAKIFGDFLAKGLIDNLDFFEKKFCQKENLQIILIPIPIHKKRLRERGYNQCEWLAKEMLKKLPKEIRQKILYKPKILQRKKYTEKQSWNNRNIRNKNIAGVFVVSQKINLENKTVLLLDDVYTTGATLKEARQTLLVAGVKRVRAITIAN